jgi:hypothetical protein
MKASDVWVYLLLGGILVWWWFSYHGTVDLGANATVGGKSVDTRVKGPLEVAPGELPGSGDAVDPGVFIANPWTYL